MPFHAHLQPHGKWLFFKDDDELFQLGPETMFSYVNDLVRRLNEAEKLEPGMFCTVCNDNLTRAECESGQCNTCQDGGES